jgi:predicted nucleic acid-binding protein
VSGRTATHRPLELVYDTGALVAAERNGRRMWALHARALQRGVRPVVPAGCVVEAWRGGRQPSLARLLEGCEIEPLEFTNAMRSGALRRGAAERVGPIDATVAEAAVRRRAAVVTSDRRDIERLAESARRRLAVIDV